MADLDKWLAAYMDGLVSMENGFAGLLDSGSFVSMACLLSFQKGILTLRCLDMFKF